MGKKIIGREREIEKIDRLLKSSSSEFLALYGRRRVGKTFLIRQHLKEYIKFSFTGSYKTKTTIQIDNFYREYLVRTKGKLKTTTPQNWHEAFSYLAEYIERFKGNNKKTVIFIDELPWLDMPRSEFISALEYFWNHYLSNMDHILLIVCGSAASWMQNKLIKAKGGLYNRVTSRIELNPFNLYETELYCKKNRIKLTRYQIIQLYMVMGGIPFYLNELTIGKSAEQLIDDICFQKNGLLTNEYEQLYYSLFKNAENHISIIEALAKHPNGMIREKLLHKSALPDGGTFTRTLKELLESGFVSANLPYLKKKKDTIYRLTDQYTLFYINFIKDNTKSNPNTWQKIQSQAKFKAWSGYAFENICLAHIYQIVNKLGLSGTYTNAFSWRHAANEEFPGAQIDLLIERRDGVINICEVKYTKDEFTITKKYHEDLRRKLSVFKGVTKSKNLIVTTLITTYPALQNKYYLEEIHSEVNMDELFNPSY